MTKCGGSDCADAVKLVLLLLLLLSLLLVVVLV
jgi:hypothetical protein